MSGFPKMKFPGWNILMKEGKTDSEPVGGRFKGVFENYALYSQSKESLLTVHSSRAC